GGLSRQRHQRRLVRPDGGPLSALESPGDAGHRGACGDRPCRELRHLGHGGSAGPRARCDRARSPHGRSEYAHHERCDDAVRAARGLGGDAGGDRDARVRRRAGSATMEIGARWGGGAVRLGVDIGGTFTDLVAVAADGAIAVRKVATTPEDPAVGMFRAIEPLPGPVELLVHGTTIATNALLERRGAKVVLVTTRGFEDLLWLRRQDRAALYDLARDHAPPLVGRGDVIGVAERMGPAGAQEPLTDAEIDRVVAAARALAPESVAVAFLFAFRHPEHERRVATALRSALAGVPVAASHEVLPVFREFERISTTTVESYLRPKVSAYLARLDQEARGRGVGTLRIMTSAGGTLAPAPAACRAAALALSGPAGGVVGARLVGAALGLSELLTLDMGGTSADASLVTGGAAVHDGGGGGGGVPLALPAILIETVSAGGGSIARVDEGGALKVGPESAGAVPGPACYGRGGE